jgi:AcrR family transcriptional regulator
MFDRTCVDEAGEDYGEEALLAYARAYRDFATRHPGLFQHMTSVRLAPADPEFVPVGRSLMARIVSPLRELGVAPEDETHAARSFRSAVHGFVVLERQRQFASGASVDESFERLLDLLVRGLGAANRPITTGR